MFKEKDSGTEIFREKVAICKKDSSANARYASERNSVQVHDTVNRDCAKLSASESSAASECTDEKLTWKLCVRTQCDVPQDFLLRFLKRDEE